MEFLGVKGNGPRRAALALAALVALAGTGCGDDDAETRINPSVKDAAGADGEQGETGEQGERGSQGETGHTR